MIEGLGRARSPTPRTEGYNRIIKQIKRVACGFRNQSNHERPIMLHSATGGARDQQSRRAPRSSARADMPGQTLIVGPSEIGAALDLRPQRLFVEGGGQVQDLVIEGVQVNVFALECPGAIWWLPRRLTPGREARVLTFRNCVFRRFTCHNFNPDCARFINCRFEDVRINCRPAQTGAHFVGCTFSGRWEGNFSGIRRGHDPFPKVAFSGNDFTDLDGGIDFDSVVEEQKFDEGGKHIVLRPGGPNWDAITALAESDRALHWTLTIISGPYARQPWALLTRWHVSPETWAELHRLSWPRAKRQ